LCIGFPLVSEWLLEDTLASLFATFYGCMLVSVSPKEEERREKRGGEEEKKRRREEGEQEKRKKRRRKREKSQEQADSKRSIMIS